MTMRNLAPIVLFVYNRLEHTEKTINALRKNELAKESDLFIFSDGPRTGEEDKVKIVRDFLKDITGFNSIHIIERDKNWGLANSVIAGVTQIVRKYGKIIVLEDDLVCSSDFLQYMNCALEKYEKALKVFSISGYSFLTDKKLEGIPDTYFLKLTSSWSWATWKDRWDYFDAQAIGYKRLIWDYKMRKEFNYDNTYDYYSMLMAQMKRETLFYSSFLLKKKHIDSWAIRWYWSVFRQGGLTLFPRDSFVKNIGFDGSGTHCGNNYDMSRTITGMLYEDFVYEELIEEKKWIRDIIKSCF